MAATNVMRISSDFSTNRHAAKLQEIQVPARHPDICFEDGNLAVLTGSYYCLVHKGVLSRRSDTLKKLARGLEGENVQFLEGGPVLHLQDSPDDLARFLQALYDGMYEDQFPLRYRTIHSFRICSSCMVYDGTTFPTVSGLLRLSTKYRVDHLREEIIRGLSTSWPTTLSQWEARELRATDATGVYAPRHALPHPM